MSPTCPTEPERRRDWGGLRRGGDCQAVQWRQSVLPILRCVHVPRPLDLLSGTEALLPTGKQVVDFWRWGFSDLRSNVVRGVLAEFLVASAVGADLSTPRDAWADYDCTSRDGIRVEVKSTATWQSWPQRGRSDHRFGRLRGQALTAEGGYSGAPVVRADVFVFAVHDCLSPEDYDPLDLGQWSWWLLPGRVIDGLQNAAGQPVDELSLARVKREGAVASSWADLAGAVAASAASVST